MNQANIRDTLIKARVLINTPDRWTRLTYVGEMNGVKAYCASGAIATVMDWNIDHETVRAHLQATIERHTGEVRHVSAWNDSPERTHAEVMQMFDWAIAEANSAEVVA